MQHKLINGRWRWAPDGLFISYAKLSDHATASGGAVASADTWFIRNLTHEDHDPDGIVSLNTSTNKFTLQPGTYWIKGLASFMKIDSSSVRIYNYTDSSVACSGTLDYSQDAAFYGSSAPVTTGRVTITAATEFGLEGITAATNTDATAKGPIDSAFHSDGSSYTELATVEIFKES
tara:strand:+ start:12233 stop:12760 length:528 start_codon:yes stop_codon:yes gene_type:complete